MSKARCNIKKKVVGQVVKGMGGIYTVKTQQGEIFKCFARGKLKRSGEIYIGDMVSVVVDKEGIIEEILPRKSMLVRPYVSNIETIVIVLAPLPKPDMVLVDKLIIGALQQDVEPVICVNKADMEGADEILQQVVKDYEGMADIMIISTQTGQGLDELMQKIKGKYVCLAGQSAVGKSSLVNTISGQQKMKVGELSKKGDKGKNTTRHVEIIELEDGTKIADTCGFSMLEMPLIDPATLAGYYTDFDEFAEDCKFRSCTHSDEEVCGVKSAVEQGRLSKERYDRYLRLYKDVKRRWEKRYD
ncbi:MAG: ribosome small subunit-dependent GTPase A [Christensenellales bacterium]